MIQSSNIAALDYAKDGTLTVTFKSGGTWEYLGVPATVYLAMLQAPSVGSYFHHNVRSRYVSRKVS